MDKYCTDETYFMVNKPTWQIEVRCRGMKCIYGASINADKWLSKYGLLETLSKIPIFWICTRV